MGRESSKHGDAGQQDGYLSALTEAGFHPKFLDGIVKYVRACGAKHVLSRKMRAFVAIAIHSAITQFCGPSVRLHIREALSAGATREELLCVLLCASQLGIHATTEGVPLLRRVLRENGWPEVELDQRRIKIKADYIASRGYWPEPQSPMLELDPDFQQAFLDYGAVTRSGPLDIKTIELLSLARDVVAGHMYNVGTELHIRTALKLGISVDEILEVIQLTTLAGLDTLTLCGPILEEELERAEKESRS